MTIFDLAYLFHFAKKNGWKPSRAVEKGLASLEEARQLWESWALENYGRQIGTKDAQALSDALLNACRSIARELAECPAQTVPADWARWNTGNLLLFADFCRGGKFQLGGAVKAEFAASGSADT